MEISLNSDVLQSLPAPDRNGLVRVLVAMKVSSDGKAKLVEINDVPCGSYKEDEEQDVDAATRAMPSPKDIAAQITG